jgi:hypothetical protein
MPLSATRPTFGLPAKPLIMPSGEHKKWGDSLTIKGIAPSNSALFSTRQNSPYAELGIRGIFTNTDATTSKVTLHLPERAAQILREACCGFHRSCLSSMMICRCVEVVSLKYLDPGIRAQN